MPYINFTDEEKQRARSVDIVSLLEIPHEKDWNEELYGLKAENEETEEMKWTAQPR